MSNRTDTAKTFLAHFEASHADTALPIPLRETHRVLSCTYSRQNKACYMVKDKHTDETYILKSGQCSQERAPLGIEHERLQLLATTFPDEYVCSKYWKEGETEYLLRPYIQGMNLEQYQESNRTLPLQEVLSIGIGICDSVSRLHALQPCILHRDIKPQNLIIDDDGRIHLIDFETAREYKENQSKDTVFWGTEGIAPPEQYGFSQTDVRSDIYGIGKVLEYLYEENKDTRTWVLYPARDKQLLQNLIRTATAFDPANRYQHVTQLRSALKKALRRLDARAPRRYRTAGILNLATAAVLAAVALFMADRLFYAPDGKDTNQNPSPAQAESSWAESSQAESPESESSEPESASSDTNGDEAGSQTGDEQILTFDGTLEHAAALTLGKETLSEEDYDKITSIALIGNRVYYADKDSGMLEDMLFCDAFEEVANGGIDDISVMAKMKNLKEVFLCKQRITDISPLRELPIEKLYLSHNRITDFSPIESMGNLVTLYMDDNPASVLPDFKKCSRLFTLWLDNNIYDDLDMLRGTNIGTLSICETLLKSKDFGALREMKNLTTLYTGENQKELYDTVCDLTGLTCLSLWGYSGGEDLSILKNMSELTRLMLGGDSLTRLDGVQYASSLETLNLDGTAITDLSLLPELPRLTHVKINGTDIKDFSPLFRCDLLQTVSADAAQQKFIEDMEPTHGFALVSD